MLSDLTGKALAVHCIFLAAGYTFRIIYELFEAQYEWLNMIEQFCQLSAYAWLTIVWINIYLVTQKYIKIEKSQRENPKKKYLFGVTAFAIFVPALLVALAHSYDDFCKIFLKGICISVKSRSSLRFNTYFIGLTKNYVSCYIFPISLNFLVCFTLYIPTKILLRFVEKAIRNRTVPGCRNREYCRFFKKYQRL